MIGQELPHKLTTNIIRLQYTILDIQ